MQSHYHFTGLLSNVTSCDNPKDTKMTDYDLPSYLPVSTSLIRDLDFELLKHGKKKIKIGKNYLIKVYDNNISIVNRKVIYN